MEPKLIPKTVTVRIINVMLEGGILIPFTIWPEDSFNDSEDGDWLYAIQNGEAFEVVRDKILYISERRVEQQERPELTTLSQELIDAFNGTKKPTRSH